MNLSNVPSCQDISSLRIITQPESPSSQIGGFSEPIDLTKLVKRVEMLENIVESILQLIPWLKVPEGFFKSINNHE